MAPRTKFKTAILQIGNNTGIEVPETSVKELGSSKRPAVKVTLNGFTYRSTIAVMGGKFLIPLSAERREKAKVKGGDKLDIILDLDTEVREVSLHADFKKALDKDKKAKGFFDTLSYSGKKAYAFPIEQAKGDDTRKRRIEKALNDLRAGKK